MNDTQTQQLIDDLASRGYRYDGGDAETRAAIAQEWIDLEFSADEASDWMDAGFWDPGTAADVRLMGIQASEVAGLCNDLITGYDDPVYSMCNGDLSVEALRLHE